MEQRGIIAIHLGSSPLDVVCEAMGEASRSIGAFIHVHSRELYDTALRLATKSFATCIDDVFAYMIVDRFKFKRFCLDSVKMGVQIARTLVM